MGAGEYQVVDLGSANGTFVNDQMVNTAIIHNNDVIRFGKYTLWVGYEADRRNTPRDMQTVVAPVTEGSGHTVILSRAEIGTILEQEKRKATVRSTTELANARSLAKQRRFLWLSLALGLLLGVGGGIAAMWWYMQQHLKH
jgi:pSer/pThr/pTyr-binding forkhead associated (FHA) protein